MSVGTAEAPRAASVDAIAGERSERRGIVGAAGAARRRPRGLRIGIVTAQLIVVAAGLGLMQWAVDSGTVKSLYLASPTQIVEAFPDLIVEGNLFGNLLVTLWEATLGVVLGFAFGVGTGVIMGLSKTIEQFLRPFVSAAMAVPKVTLIPLLTFYIGIGIEHKVAIVFLFSYFLFVFNTLAGIRQVDANHLKIARVNRASQWQTVTKVILPSASPTIVAALRIEAGTALVAALFAEIIASKAGLGNMLNTAVGKYDTPSIFGLVLAITVFSVLIIAAVDLLEKKVLLRWKYLQ
ncbi:ABC transporter permease [Agromyces sp. PvR057]|uniref:ABC transporter permease n=1 Tax=Agromyces sp. PvR057 TaxID=3156403 RepID=UPI000E27593C